MDIKCAYLQGLPLERELFMVPPRDVSTNVIWKLLKCPYGLADAGRKWYLKLLSVLTSLGAKQSKLDQAIFTWHDLDGDCIRIMAVHVDDIIYGGTEIFLEQVIAQLREKLKVGLEESNGIKYIGLMISQSENGISISTDPYCHSLTEINCLGLNKSLELHDDEKSELRHLSGQLNWITSQSRPDLAYDNCIVANSIRASQVKDVIKANTSVQKAKYHDVSLRYNWTVDLESCKIIGYTDSSFGNLSDGGSQGSFVILLIDIRGQPSLISWQSLRIRRVANSSLAAECIAAVEAADFCIYLQTLLREIQSKMVNTPCCQLASLYPSHTGQTDTKPTKIVNFSMGRPPTMLPKTP